MNPFKSFRYGGKMKPSLQMTLKAEGETKLDVEGTSVFALIKQEDGIAASYVTQREDPSDREQEVFEYVTASLILALQHLDKPDYIIPMLQTALPAALETILTLPNIDLEVRDEIEELLAGIQAAEEEAATEEFPLKDNVVQFKRDKDVH